MNTSNEPRFSVLHGNSEADRLIWFQIWESWPRREIFAHPDYIKLYAEGIGTPTAAVSHHESGTVLYPFIVRFIPGKREYVDIISPYGYGGCFVWGTEDRDVLLREFTHQFDDWASSRGVVSEFVRLSLFPDQIPQYPDDIRERSANVVRPLALNEEGLWRDYEAKVRKNVKKALRNEVRVEVDENGHSLEAFYQVFSSTMDRREAANSYRFSLEFFQDLTASLQGHIAFFNAIHRDGVVSTELVLVSSRSVYSFLGGTLSDSFDVRPNDLLKHELILWAKAKGKDNYVLGGGYQPNDGIFRYKKSFAPNGIVPFRTGERILNHVAYDALVEAKVRSRAASGIHDPLNESFFPLYRAG